MHIWLYVYVYDFASLHSQLSLLPTEPTILPKANILALHITSYYLKFNETQIEIIIQLLATDKSNPGDKRAN